MPASRSPGPLPAVAPPCLPPGPVSRPTQVAVPPGAWDTHAHVIGPFDRFPLQPVRSYTPAESPEADYDHMLATLGMGRGVVVQPSIYGTDNRLTVEATRRGGASRRGIVVLGGDCDAGTIEHLHAAGIRGFRINLLFDGGPGLDFLERTAALVAPFGWHAQLLVDIRNLPGMAPRLDALGLPLVFDHMGHFPWELGTDWPGFRALQRRIDGGRAYVKLSGSYRLSPRASHVLDVAPIARALVAQAPERLLWGSDWPHVGLHRHMPATADLLDALACWCPDPTTRQRILVDNPERLYA